MFYQLASGCIMMNGVCLVGGHHQLPGEVFGALRDYVLESNLLFEREHPQAETATASSFHPGGNLFISCCNELMALPSLLYTQGEVYECMCVCVCVHAEHLLTGWEIDVVFGGSWPQTQTSDSTYLRFFGLVKLHLEQFVTKDQRNISRMLHMFITFSFDGLHSEWFALRFKNEERFALQQQH